MKEQNYKNQVRLLLDVLPEVAKEDCLALHGGTAINLFVKDMPRLSIDIDLTYLPIENRQTTLHNIDAVLKRIKSRIEAVISRVDIQHKSETGKLFIRYNGAEIKLEVNLIGRGAISNPTKMLLCNRAQEEYNVSVIMPVVPLDQLYGGKICAALDRQHPRDLFDIKYHLDNENFFNEVRKGFLLCLLSGGRPINEVLVPNFQDQRQVLENQFAGMSKEVFTYNDFTRTREKLVSVIREGLTEFDKTFLLSFKNGEPDWSIHNFERFPAVQWKLQNLQKLKIMNSEKHKELYKALKEKLTGKTT